MRRIRFRTREAFRVAVNDGEQLLIKQKLIDLRQNLRSHDRTHNVWSERQLSETAVTEATPLSWARQNWPWMLLIAILLLGLSAWAIVQIASHTDQDAIGASGFVLTAWGVVISMMGFAVTWWQLARTQTAASAAQGAVLKLKRAFGSLDIITELRTARESARQTRNHIETTRWGEAAVGFDRTREGLNKIVAINGMLAQTDSEAARDFISICIDGYQSSQRLVADAQAPISVETLLIRLQELDGFLIEVEFKIKDGMNANE